MPRYLRESNHSLRLQLPKAANVDLAPPSVSHMIVADTRNALATCSQEDGYVVTKFAALHYFCEGDRQEN